MAQQTMVTTLPLAPVTGRELVRRIPTMWKVAVVLGVLGWFFSLGMSTTTSINGVRDCEGLDLGPLVVAGLVAAMGVAGFQRARRAHPRLRLPNAATCGGVAVLAAIVAVHVLRVVLDPAGRTC
jgi:uncharacterized membrane protein YidH (DUF202 family)